MTIVLQGFPGGSDGKEEYASMQKIQVQTLGQEDPVEKEMATHSSVLAWRIPWTKEFMDNTVVSNTKKFTSVILIPDEPYMRISLAQNTSASMENFYFSLHPAK